MRKLLSTLSTCRLLKIEMENRIFDLSAEIFIFLTIGVVVVTYDATHYMKKDHSLIKPYAGVIVNSDSFPLWLNAGV